MLSTIAVAMLATSATASTQLLPRQVSHPSHSISLDILHPFCTSIHKATNRIRHVDLEGAGGYHCELPHGQRFVTNKAPPDISQHHIARIRR